MSYTIDERGGTGLYLALNRGDEIRRLRERAGLGQHDTGKVADCSGAVVSTLERGIHSPTLENYVNVAAAVGATVHLRYEEDGRMIDCRLEPTIAQVSVEARVPTPSARDLHLAACAGLEGGDCDCGLPSLVAALERSTGRSTVVATPTVSAEALAT